MFVSRGLRLVMLIGLFSLWSVPPALADDDGFEVNVPAGFSGPLLLKDGRLLAVDRIGISGLISTDGGRTWQKSGRLADRDGQPIGGKKPQRSFAVSLIRLASGGIGAKFELPQEGFSRQATKLDAYYSTSIDEAQTWSKPVRITWPHSPTNSTWLIQTRGGRFVLANEYWYTQPGDRGLGVCSAFYSDDRGQTWRESGERLWVWEKGGVSQGSAEVPCIVEASDGRLLMFMRTYYQRIAQSESHDGGKTWSGVKLNNLASGNSEIYLARIPPTDDLLCIWNQASAEEIKTGFYRARLTAALSKDNGKSWQNFRTFAASPGQQKVGRITPTDPPGFLRTPMAVPTKELMRADEFHMNRAPRIAFVGDRTYVTYTHRKYRYEGSKRKAIENSRKLRVLPTAWFYGKEK